MSRLGACIVHFIFFHNDLVVHSSKLLIVVVANDVFVNELQCFVCRVLVLPPQIQVVQTRNQHVILHKPIRYARSVRDHLLYIFSRLARHDGGPQVFCLVILEFVRKIFLPVFVGLMPKVNVPLEKNCTLCRRMANRAQN